MGVKQLLKIVRRWKFQSSKETPGAASKRKGPLLRRQPVLSDQHLTLAISAQEIVQSKYIV